jgi:sugar (pentulose or hexulose) kinase
MNKTPVIAIFDVGKTNKKLFLFDEHYQLVYEESKQFTEIKDEDGFSCEDISALTNWVKLSFEKILTDERFEIKAVNFSAYGASFVYLNEEKNVILPLYNYLKPYSETLKKKFYIAYGGESRFSKKTASPVLGNLNSGMQLYRLKYEKPEQFKQIKYALHLPQYLSFVLSSSVYSEMTSIGCHTNLWDFQEQNYHVWVSSEAVLEKFPPVLNSNKIAGIIKEAVRVGVGLHDSSAALIPYLTAFKEPFILLSTGTWCISLNPFNHSLLSDYELHQDCLCYLSYEGKPVKASRLFAGNEHEQQTKKLASFFKTDEGYYKSVEFNKKYISENDIKNVMLKHRKDSVMIKQSAFADRALNQFKNYEEAYHQLILNIIRQQVTSVNIVLKNSPVKKIFVDGGFSKNPVYMQLLAKAIPETEIYAASMAQATALGAAIAIHDSWNTKSLPNNLIELQFYSSKKDTQSPLKI